MGVLQFQTLGSLPKQAKDPDSRIIRARIRHTTNNKCAGMTFKGTDTDTDKVSGPEMSRRFKTNPGLGDY